MLEHLPQDVSDALGGAQPRFAARDTRRLRVRIGDATFPVLRMWSDGFAIRAPEAIRLRGFVDILDGLRHRWTCMIVASEFGNGELSCNFKRITPARDTAPRDYCDEGE